MRSLRTLLRATGLLAVVLAFASTVVSAQGPVTTEDAAAIRDLVQRYLTAREMNDRSAVEALFTPDADQLVSTGEWRRGRDALVTGALASSAATSGTRTITIETIRTISADIALADGRYEIAASGNTPLRQMWASFLVVRQGAAWRISAIRNMLPAAAAAAPAAR